MGEYSIHKNQEQIKRSIGYLPESNPLYTDMPVIDYLTFVADLQGIHKSRTKDRIFEMVHTCGLEGEEQEDEKNGGR